MDGLYPLLSPSLAWFWSLSLDAQGGLISGLSMPFIATRIGLGSSMVDLMHVTPIVVAICLLLGVGHLPNELVSSLVEPRH